MEAIFSTKTVLVENIAFYERYTYHTMAQRIAQKLRKTARYWHRKCGTFDLQLWDFRTSTAAHLKTNCGTFDAQKCHSWMGNGGGEAKNAWFLPSSRAIFALFPLQMERKLCRKMKDEEGRMEDGNLPTPEPSETVWCLALRNL